MFISTFWLVMLGLFILAIIAGLVRACVLLVKSQAYNLRLFTQVLTEKETNEKLGHHIRRLQNGRQPVRGFSQQKQ